MRRSRKTESNFSWKTSGRNFLARLILILARQIGLVGLIRFVGPEGVGFESGYLNARRAGRRGLAGGIHFGALVDDDVEMRLAGHDVIGGEDFGAGADESGGVG